mgnify:CR=1 FL=1
MNKLTIAAVAVLSMSLAHTATARDANEDAIKARQAAFTLIAANTGPMGAMMKGEMPFDKKAFAQHASNVEVLSGMPWSFFIPGSQKGDTKAKPDVWNKAEDYRAKAEKFQEQAGKLAMVAKNGDESAIKKQFGATVKTCKSCHDDYKSK